MSSVIDFSTDQRVINTVLYGISSYHFLYIIVRESLEITIDGKWWQTYTYHIATYKYNLYRKFVIKEIQKAWIPGPWL